MPDADPASLTGPSFELRIQRVLLVLLSGMLIVVASGVLSAWALASAASDVGRIDQSRLALRGVVEGMVDQESGVRGFLITERESFLETYGPGEATADANRILLDTLSDDLDGAERVLDDLDRAITDWRGVADEEIRLVRDGRGNEAVAIAESGAAKERFDLIREQVRSIDERLSEISDSRNQRQADLERLLAVIGVVVALGALAVIIATLRWLRRSVTRPLAALTVHADPADPAVYVLDGKVAGEVAAVAKSADRMRRAADLERNEAVLVAEQAERQRIAADLHDGPVQMLFAVQLRLQHLLTGHRDDPDVADVVGSGIEVLEATQSDLRLLMFDLAPPGLGDKSLADVVAATVPQVLDPPARSVIDVPEDVIFDTTSQLVACRVIVEAIRNVNRHAKATTVTVRIRSIGDIVTVEVIDDGEGFDAAGSVPVGHFGLGIMRSLVESVSGEFDVRSAPGSGTTVHVTLPVSPSPAQ